MHYFISIIFTIINIPFTISNPIILVKKKSTFFQLWSPIPLKNRSSHEHKHERGGRGPFVFTIGEQGQKCDMCDMTQLCSRPADGNKRGRFILNRSLLARTGGTKHESYFSLCVPVWQKRVCIQRRGRSEGGSFVRGVFRVVGPKHPVLRAAGRLL